MAKTRDDLAERALQKLQVDGGTGQSPDAEDLARADAVIDALFADLGARNIYTVTDEDDIDDAAFEWLALILADTLAPDFGLAMDPNKAAFAENKLQRIVASEPTYEKMKAEYF